MAKKIAYIFLTVLFLFSLTLSISAKENFLIRDKDTEKKLIELWNGDDAKAFEDFFSYYFEEDGGFAPRLFDPEIGQSFRNEEDKLIVLTFSFDREAMIASEYGEYYLEFEKEYPYNLGSFYFSLISYDGTTYNTERKNALNKKVYTFKEIIRECGIEDSSEIGLARFERLSSYGTFSFEFMDYTSGWNEIDGERYYIKSDGTVLTKSATIDGIRYKFGKDGVCQGRYTGKVKSGNKIICYKDGVKQDELFMGWFKSGGKRFYAEEGVIRTGWVNISPDWYYIDPKEGRLTGTHEIDGVSCTFDRNGKWDKKTVKSADSVYNYVERKMDKNLYGGVYWQDGMVMVWSVDGKAEKKLQKRYPNNGGICYLKADYSVYQMERIMISIRAKFPNDWTSMGIYPMENRLKLGFTDEQLKKVKPYLDTLEDKGCIDIVDETGVIFYDD